MLVPHSKLWEMSIIKLFVLVAHFLVPKLSAEIRTMGFKVKTKILLLDFYKKSNKYIYLHVQATKNLSQSSWDDAILQSLMTRDHLACAHQCAATSWPSQVKSEEWCLLRKTQYSEKAPIVQLNTV